MKKNIKVNDVVVVLNGKFKGEVGKVVKKGQGQYDVELKDGVVYLGIDDIVLDEQKEIKIVSRKFVETMMILTQRQMNNALKKGAKYLYIHEVYNETKGDTVSIFYSNKLYKDSKELLSGHFNEKNNVLVGEPMIVYLESISEDIIDIKKVGRKFLAETENIEEIPVTKEQMDSFKEGKKLSLVYIDGEDKVDILRIW